MSPDDLFDLFTRRRSQLTLDRERPVDDALVTRLCEAATWAPNHRQTWPWRFGVFIGESRGTLGNVIADAMAARGDEARIVDKTRTKYLRAPVVIVVGAAPGASELESEENRDAVAAGMQNLLLLATANGLGTLWSTCPKGANDPVVAHCGWETGTHVSGIVYLGWPTDTLPRKERPAPEITRFG